MAQSTVNVVCASCNAPIAGDDCFTWKLITGRVNRITGLPMTQHVMICATCLPPR